MHLCLSVLLLVANVGCAQQYSENWWSDKDAYQQDLMKRTRAIPRQRFEVGVVRWQAEQSSRDKFDGPWTEERFLDHWQGKQPKIDRIYLPVQWTNAEAIEADQWRWLHDHYINTLLAGLDRQYKYFTVIQIANAFQNTLSVWDIPLDLDLTVYSTGPTETGTRAVPIPLLKEVLEPQGLAKDLSITFHGDMSVPIRQELHKLHGKNDIFKFYGHHKDWVSQMERSNFTLAPRGWGHDSFRRWEALQLGTIPVYVYDSAEPWLPYAELLDWEKLSLNVAAEDSSKIADWVRALENTGMVPIMHQYIKDCHSFFTYEFMLEYIIHDLLIHNTLQNDDEL